MLAGVLVGFACVAINLSGTKADLLQEGQLLLGLRSHAEQFWLAGDKYRRVTVAGNYFVKLVPGGCHAQAAFFGPPYCW